MTHEPELREPVDLCTPDGARLAPAARGWSRRPLHRANLDGAEIGRNKRWDYWAVLAGDVVVSCVYSDIDVIGLADVWWAEMRTGRDGLNLEIEADDTAGTRIRATWAEPDGRAGRFDLAVSRPADLESINVVIPWSDDTFNFTSKQQALPTTGSLTVGDETFVIGGDSDAWGVLDVGRGRWPSSIRWNWGGGAGCVGDHVVGLQFGARWTEGTGFTENGFLLDGLATKIGRELIWTYDWEDPMSPWTIEDPGGQLSVVLNPVFDNYTSTGDATLGSEVHQVFGRYSGSSSTTPVVGWSSASFRGSPRRPARTGDEHRGRTHSKTIASGSG